jgi:hypothetical protein
LPLFRKQWQPAQVMAMPFLWLVSPV